MGYPIRRRFFFYAHENQRAQLPLQSDAVGWVHPMGRLELLEWCASARLPGAAGLVEERIPFMAREPLGRGRRGALLPAKEGSGAAFASCQKRPALAADKKAQWPIAYIALPPRLRKHI